MHGGNRLNSNAVPDTQVFGHRAGVAAARARQGGARRQPDPRPLETWQRGGCRRLQSDAATPCARHSPLCTTSCKQAMTLGIGIVRTRRRVAAGDRPMPAPIRERLARVAGPHAWAI